MGTLESLKKHFVSNNKIREYSAHSSKVHTVDWNCDGRRLGSGSFDKSVCIFTLERDRLVNILIIAHRTRWVFKTRK